MGRVVVLVFLLFSSLLLGVVSPAPVRGLVVGSSGGVGVTNNTSFLAPKWVSFEPWLSVNYIGLADLYGNGTYTIFAAIGVSLVMFDRFGNETTIFNTQDYILNRTGFLRNYDGSSGGHVGLRPAYVSSIHLAVYDLDLDGREEVVYVCTEFVVFVDDDLSIISILNLSSIAEEQNISFILFLPALGDPVFLQLDSDPYPELILPVGYVGMFLFDDVAHNFSFVGFAPGQEFIRANNIKYLDCIDVPLVGDVDGDGHLEVVGRIFYNKGRENYHGFFVYDLVSGEVESFIQLDDDFWPYRIYFLPGTSPRYIYTVLGAKGFGFRLARFSLEEGFRAYTKENISEVFLFDFRPLGFNYVHASLSFFDVDFDGRYEIFALAFNTSSTRPESNGVVIIDDDFSLFGVVRPPVFMDMHKQEVVFGDVDDDFYPDILVGLGNVLWVVSGRTLETIALVNITDFYIPHIGMDIHEILLGDVDGDGLVEVVVASFDYVGVFDAEGWGSPWVQFRSDASKDGALNDSDGDMFPDYLEVFYGLSPGNPDCDGDCCLDGYEFYVLGSDPRVADVSCCSSSGGSGVGVSSSGGSGVLLFVVVFVGVLGVGVFAFWWFRRRRRAGG